MASELVSAVTAVPAGGAGRAPPLPPMTPFRLALDESVTGRRRRYTQVPQVPAART